MWGLAESCYALGKRSRALDLYRRFLVLRPGNAEALHTVAALGGAAPPDRAPDSYVVSLFDRYAADFDRSLMEDLHYRGPDALHALVTEMLPGAQALDVVDLGCGTGLSGIPFRSLARALVGVDLSPEMLARAQARNIYDKLERAELAAILTARREEFDLAIAVDSFCYAGDLAPIFRAVAVALRRGGHLAFTVEARRGRGWRLTGSGRYAHNPAWLRKTAHDAGVEEVVGRDAVLRHEYGKPVEAYMSVMRRV